MLMGHVKITAIIPTYRDLEATQNLIKSGTRREEGSRRKDEEPSSQASIL
jgi:hypothetical protein